MCRLLLPLLLPALLRAQPAPAPKPAQRDQGYAITALSVTIQAPGGLALDRAGNLYVVERGGNGLIKRIDASGSATTIAGGGKELRADRAPAATLSLPMPSSVAVDRDGNVYFTDVTQRVRRVSPDGTAIVFAGSARQGFAGDDGPANQALLNIPAGLACDEKGSLYVADLQNDRVRLVSPSGTISTFAGGGVREGKRTDKDYKFGLADRAFVVEAGYEGVLRQRWTVMSGLRLMKTTDSTGEVLCERCGDGGPASQAELTGPLALAVDGKGNLFIADHYAHRVRKVDPAGTITTVAGNGMRGASGAGDGGPATQAGVFYPRAVAADASGNLYIAEMYGRIRKVNSKGVISTMRPAADMPDMSLEVALLFSELGIAGGLAADAAGNVFFSDTANGKLLKLTPPPPPPVSKQPPPRKTSPRPTPKTIPK